MVSSLPERFRRAVVSDDLASARMIAERAMAETRNDSHPFDIRNQTVLRSFSQLSSSHASSNYLDKTLLDNGNMEVLPALSAAQHRYARQSRGRDRNREAGRCKSSLALAIETGASIELIQWLLDMGHEKGTFSRDVRSCTLVSIAAQHNRIDAIEACCIDCVANSATMHHQRSTTFDTQFRRHADEEDEEEEEEEKEKEKREKKEERGKDGARIDGMRVDDEVHSSTSDRLIRNAKIERQVRPSFEKELPRLPMLHSPDAFAEEFSDPGSIESRGNGNDDEDEEGGTDEDLVARELLQLLDSPDELGRTALSLASMKGYHDVVGHLVDLGASINVADYEGNTPLHYAASYNHLLIVQLLIERGCAFATKNSFGFTAADYAYTSSLKGALEAFARAKYERDRKGVYESNDERVPIQKLKNTLLSPAKVLQANPHFRLATQLRDLHI